MSTRPRVVTFVPDTSEDEDISDDDEYRIPKPLESVYLPESEVSSSDSDSGDEEQVMRNQPSSSSSTVKKTKKVKPVAVDGFNHWPEWKSDRQRCRMVGCKQKSQIYCQKCKCYLCLNKDRNCFTQFHTI